jgi:CBS domain-containing protein
VREVPTCFLTDDLTEVRERVALAGWPICVVVNEANVVLGLLGRQALSSAAEGTVEDAMTEGPRTIRTNKPAAEVLERLQRQNISTAIVTTSEGRLVGVVRLDTLE